MFQGLLKDFGVSNYADYKIVHICGVSLLILFPICMIDKVSRLSYGMYLSVIAVLYTSVVLLVELFFFWNTDRFLKEVVYFRFDANFFSAFGITFFAFYCQVNFFSSVKNMIKLDEPHLNKVMLSVNRRLCIEV
eukprot:TRINITY_DN8395_c0_g1_i1.p2 TRINITY_DN8395_c0_g1~~TRINITY_DN8395_c0_g1_i1.p2  ORF type:complete len:134 (+),score=30.19 TRINITY_DN8395_c0_g1_i1:662-1063(+)